MYLSKRQPLSATMQLSYVPQYLQSNTVSKKLLDVWQLICQISPDFSLSIDVPEICIYYPLDFFFVKKYENI